MKWLVRSRALEVFFSTECMLLSFRRKTTSQISPIIVKMKLASMTVFLLCILMARTDGRQCWYRFGRCYDKGDLRGKCGDWGGTCYRVTGTQECMCSSHQNALGLDEFRRT